MKTETKILIILIILILSVGPLTFFLEGKKEIELPEREEQPLFHEINANITGKIMSFEPYISYVGISSSNNKTYADEIIKSIGIKNYSLEMSLNPEGPGYQYSILIPLNETQNAREIGFRLAFRFLEFFMPGTLPLIVGEAELPTLFPANQTAAVTAKENFTTKTIFLYSKQVDEYAEINCNLVTSLNYSLVKISGNCYDNDILEQQQFLGLAAQDFYVLPVKQKTMNLTVEQINQAVFEGSFEYGVNVSKDLLENQTNATAEVQEPEKVLTLYNTNASLLNLTDDFFQQDNNTIVYFENLSKTLQEVEEQLRKIPKYALPKGSFSVKTFSLNETIISNIESILISNQLNITKKYKIGTADLPEKLELEGSTYDLLRIRQAPIDLKMDSEPGNITASITFSILYEEIVNAKGEQV